MKKQKLLSLLCGIFMLALVVLFGTNVEAATSKTATKNKVYKSITSVKSGKYTYFSDGTAIYRQKAGEKKQKISKYKADGDFIIDGNYIYYHSFTNAKLYRMTKNGKSQKKYRVNVTRVAVIQDGYIYYKNHSGLWKMDVEGQNKQRLLRYSKAYHYVITTDRIYYSDYKKEESADEKGTKYTTYIKSMNLEGKDKKIIQQFDGHNTDFYTDGRYIYKTVAVEEGWEIGVIDTQDAEATYKTLKFFAEDASYDPEDLDTLYYQIIAVIDGVGYFQTKDTLYTIDVNGNVEKVIKLPKKNEDGLKIQKQGDYYWLKFLGDDDFSTNYIYDCNWKKVKMFGRKYGYIIKMKIKKDKAYIVFDKSFDLLNEEKYMRYRIVDLK